MKDSITVVTVPSEAGTHWGGQAKAPAALLGAGLIHKLESKGFDTKIVSALREPHLWAPHPLNNGVRNEKGVLEVMQDVRATLLPVFSSDTVPVVIGGDCSITPAVLSALSGPDSRRVGMIYFDGDVDLSLPTSENRPPDSDACVLDSMVLTHLTGRRGGLSSIRDFLHLKHEGVAEALVTASNTVLFGFDPEQPKPEHWLFLLENQFKAIGAPRVRESPVAAAAEALSWLEARCDYILVHFDLDVVSSEQFPLGNYPHYGGLLFEEAMECLKKFMRSNKLAGLVVTEVNPGNDPGGRLVERLVDGIVDTFERD